MKKKKSFVISSREKASYTRQDRGNKKNAILPRLGALDQEIS